MPRIRLSFRPVGALTDGKRPGQDDLPSVGADPGQVAVGSGLIGLQASFTTGPLSYVKFRLGLDAGSPGTPRLIMPGNGGARKGVIMPRLREVPRAEATEEVVVQSYQRLFGDRDPVAEPGTATGTPGDWWTVFALVPDVLRHAVRGFALYASPKRVLPPQLRELGQTRAGWVTGSQFVFSQHCKSCRGVGIPEEKIAAIPSWPVSDVFTPVERAVLAYADGLALDGGRIADGVFDALREHLTDEQILELTYITSMYVMHAIMSRALRTEFDNRAEPVTEIAAPEAFTTRDIAVDLAGPGT
jgi:alkylhydroperoxidase family enzyme